VVWTIPSPCSGAGV